MSKKSETFTEDDTFAKLRDMKFEEAVELAIRFSEDFPLGIKQSHIISKTDKFLRQYGWSYQKLLDEHTRRTYGRN